MVCLAIWYPCMITKRYKAITGATDPRQRAGDDAEKQMAHYLHRTFANDPAVHVLHGLRLQDKAQTEQDGSPQVCQIDHLLVHRWGMFIVESKSVTGEVRVRADSSQGDEWSRVNGGREAGMPSPIQQAQRQAELLRAYLKRHDERLLGRAPVGLRTVARVVAGSDQRGFGRMPIQVMVAISDNGIVRRLDGWKEPAKPFREFVTKADLIPSKVKEELRCHRRGSNPLTHPGGNYGLWRMTHEEVSKVAEFLAESHVERSAGATSMPKPSGNAAKSSDGNRTGSAEPAVRKTQRRHARTVTPSSPVSDDIEIAPADEPLWQAMRNLRKKLADENGVPSYVIFPDATLKALVHAKPTTHEEMLALHGIGKAKLERYGDAFLVLLKRNAHQESKAR